MIELLRVLLAALMLLCLILGYWIGRWYERRYGKPKFRVGKTIIEVAVTPVDKRRLVFIGSLDERLSKRLANHVLDGKKFNGPALISKQGGGGFLSENQFNGVRDDLMARGMAHQDTRGWTHLHPPALAVFRHLAGRRNGGTR